MRRFSSMQDRCSRSAQRLRTASTAHPSRTPPIPARARAARLRWASGGASSAASLRAISVWQFMTASQGDWIGSPVVGALTKRPSARTFLPVRGAPLNPSRG